MNHPTIDEVTAFVLLSSMDTCPHEGKAAIHHFHTNPREVANGFRLLLNNCLHEAVNAIEDRAVTNAAADHIFNALGMDEEGADWHAEAMKLGAGIIREVEWIVSQRLKFRAADKVNEKRGF